MTLLMPTPLTERAAEYVQVNNVPDVSNVVLRSSHPKAHSNTAFSVTANPDGSSIKSTDLGLPSQDSYAQIEQEYLSSLSVRKQEKALLNQHMFDLIWDVLHDPESCKVGTPQFRWWVRKMFALAHTYPDGPDGDLKPVVMHEDRPVVVREQIYDVLSYCHLLSNHSGRDRTTAVVREHYSWVPKELVAQFVKACPTCTFKRTGTVQLAGSSECTDLVTVGKRRRGSSQAITRRTPSSKKVRNGGAPPAICHPSGSVPSLHELLAPTRPHDNPTGWMSSQHTSSHHPPMRRTVSDNDAYFPPGRSLPRKLSRAYSNAYSPYRRPTFVAADVNESAGGSASICSSPVMCSEVEVESALAIDPALLSESANASQLHALHDSHGVVAKTVPTMMDYMRQASSYGRYEYEVEEVE